jgi:hypothetical protein
MDQAMAAKYAEEFPGRRVACLPPAVQPAIHNPIVPAGLAKAARGRDSRVLLDGWAYFAGLGDGGRESLLSAAPALMVAESRWDMGRSALLDHPEDRPHVLGCLGALDRIGVSRLVGAELFPDEQSGPDWRAANLKLQISASGALPIGSATRLGDADPLQRSREAHRLFRDIFSSHCFAHRLQRISGDLRVARDFIGPSPDIACLLVTMRPQLVEACIRRFRKDLYPEKELVIVVHGDSVDLAPLRSHIREGERIRIYQRGSEQSLGACLNFAFAQSGCRYWCKMDDDDFYGPHYLSDFMLYRRAVDFDVAGKPMAFTLLDEADELRWDQRWGSRANLFKTAVDVANTGVAGATLFGHRRVLETTPFPERRRRGTDTEFQRRCHAEGWNLLSTDPFNFVRYRTDRSDFHTWRLSQDRIRERTVKVGTRADIAAIACP